MSEVVITVGEIKAICTDALYHYGVPSDISEEVIIELIHNEMLGYSSHGLLRLPDYIDNIRKKILIPTARPQTTNLEKGSYKIDGLRGFGCLASHAITKALISGLQNNKISTASLTNCNHIGRLETIARSVSEKGHLLVGFCNYTGAGQKVIPPNGSKARLCTNPVVFSAPIVGKPPIVLDMTTSAVAEGKVRDKMYNNKKVPDGWLVDKNNTTVNDPHRLYQDPPSAFLSPLGGADFGYKGFGLALFTEIFAGILTGAGHCTNSESIGGNGGFFIAIDLSICGQSRSNVIQEITNFADYIQSSGKMVRLPGHRNTKIAINLSDTLKISSTVLSKISLMN